MKKQNWKVILGLSLLTVQTAAAWEHVDVPKLKNVDEKLVHVFKKVVDPRVTQRSYFTNSYFYGIDGTNDGLIIGDLVRTSHLRALKPGESDVVRSFNHEQALQICKDFHAELPFGEDFLQLGYYLGGVDNREQPDQDAHYAFSNPKSLNQIDMSLLPGLFDDGSPTSVFRPGSPNKTLSSIDIWAEDGAASKIIDFEGGDLVWAFETTATGWTLAREIRYERLAVRCALRAIDYPSLKLEPMSR